MDVESFYILGRSVFDFLILFFIFQPVERGGKEVCLKRNVSTCFHGWPV